MAERAKRGRPATKGPGLNVNLKKGLRARLDSYVEEQKPKTTTTAAVEMILEEFLDRYEKERVRESER